MKQFTTIEKLDTAILYLLELSSSLSVLFLAFGLIASMANVLTKGSVLTDNILMQRIWAWTQCVAIDASVAGTIIRGYRYHQEGEEVKSWLYCVLSALLLFTAAIVSNIESVQQTLNVTLEQAYIHVFVPVEVLIWIRSIAIVLLIVCHAMRHVKLEHNQEESKPAAAPPLIITPELVQELRVLLTQTTVFEEQEEQQQTPRIAATTTATDTTQTQIQTLSDLLPAVSQAEIAAVVSAHRQGIARRSMCAHLRWGSSKYSTIVKPVLDAYAKLREQPEEV